MRTDYKVDIDEIVGADLPKKVIAAIKTNLSSAIDLAMATENDNTICFTPKSYVKLKIHNERSSGEKDYEKVIIVDTDGKFYITGSPSFRETLDGIIEEMISEDPETWAIEVYSKPSSKFKGKRFISCRVV